MLQKPSWHGPVKCLDIPLKAACPATAEGPFVQGDRPITQLHWHPCLELGFCHEGSGVFVVADKVLPFSEGDAVFINWREPHLARSTPGTASRWTWIYLDPLRLVQQTDIPTTVLDASPYCGPHFANILKAGQYPDLCQAIERLAGELLRKRRHWEAVVRAQTLEFMVAMDREFGPASEDLKGMRRSHGPGVTPAPLAGSSIGRVAPALDRLARDPSRPPSVKEMAAICALSEAQFRRCFRAALGKTPLEYSHDFRVRLAASMLTTTCYSVLHIAHETGFGVPSTFTRAFERAYGKSPGAWRRTKLQALPDRAG